jgi:hypothetical protein
MYKQVYVQLTAHYLVLMLLPVSATKRSHLQGVTTVEDIYTSFNNLSIENGRYITYLLTYSMEQRLS